MAEVIVVGRPTESVVAIVVRDLWRLREGILGEVGQNAELPVPDWPKEGSLRLYFRAPDTRHGRVYQTVEAFVGDSSQSTVTLNIVGRINGPDTPESPSWAVAKIRYLGEWESRGVENAKRYTFSLRRRYRKGENQPKTDWQVTAEYEPDKLRHMCAAGE